MSAAQKARSAGHTEFLRDTVESVSKSLALSSGDCRWLIRKIALMAEKCGLTFNANYDRAFELHPPKEVIA